TEMDELAVDDESHEPALPPLVADGETSVPQVAPSAAADVNTTSSDDPALTESDGAAESPENR
ncbi:MAG: hypothetical protein AAF961_15135, partial [Planctomycetota bacterium]